MPGRLLQSEQNLSHPDKYETLVTAGTWPEADQRQSQQRKAGAHESCVTAGHPAVLFHFLKIAAEAFVDLGATQFT